MIVHTARIDYGGPDRLDVTRKSAPPELEPFAPPGRLLGWGLRMREQCKQRILQAATPRDKRAAQDFERWMWLAYDARYREAMRASFRYRRDAFDRVLARERAVFVCFCTDPARCHRTVLADIFQQLGAEVRGELSRDDTPADWWPRRKGSA